MRVERAPDDARADVHDAGRARAGYKGAVNRIRFTVADTAMAVFNAVAVGVGEIISCCVLGVALVKLIESNESLNKIFAEQ